MFTNCPLGTIYIKAIVPPTGTIGVLSVNYSVYVPTSSVNDYKNAWPDIAERIIGYVFE